MNLLPGKCPICSGQLTVTRLQCGNCGTGIDGSFGLGRLQVLTPEQVQFVETFMRCKGKIKDVEGQLGISYPTVVSRLNDVVRAMGYDVEEGDLSEVDQFEYYQAQALNPQGGAPRQPLSPMMPPAPSAPAAPMIPTPIVPAPPTVGAARATTERREQILADLANGKISAAEALQKLNKR